MTSPDIFTYHRPDTRPGSFGKDSDIIRVVNDICVVVDGGGVYGDEEIHKPEEVPEGAEIVATSIVESIVASNLKTADKEELIRAAFINANAALRAFYKKRGVTIENADHLQHQLISTVVAFGFPHGRIFYGGQLNDAGIMTYGRYTQKDGKQYLDREIDIIQNHSPLSRHLEAKRQELGITPGSREEHVLVRRTVVNKDVVHNGNPVNFGALNGDPNAIKFCRYVAIDLLNKPAILLYTDGVISQVRDEARMLQVFDIHNSEELAQIMQSDSQKEGALVVVRF